MRNGGAVVGKLGLLVLLLPVDVVAGEDCDEEGLSQAVSKRPNNTMASKTIAGRMGGAKALLA
jgi:hypothetical protein